MWIQHSNYSAIRVLSAFIFVISCSSFNSWCRSTSTSFSTCLPLTCFQLLSFSFLSHISLVLSVSLQQALQMLGSLGSEHFEHAHPQDHSKAGMPASMMLGPLRLRSVRYLQIGSILAGMTIPHNFLSQSVSLQATSGVKHLLTEKCHMSKRRPTII